MTSGGSKAKLFIDNFLGNILAAPSLMEFASDGMCDADAVRVCNLITGTVQGAIVGHLSRTPSSHKKIQNLKYKNTKMQMRGVCDLITRAVRGPEGGRNLFADSVTHLTVVVFAFANVIAIVVIAFTVVVVVFVVSVIVHS